MENKEIQFATFRKPLANRFGAERLFTIALRLLIFFTVLALFFSMLLVAVALFYIVYTPLAIVLSFVIIVGSLGLVFAGDMSVLKGIWSVFEALNNPTIRNVQVITTPIFLSLALACWIFVLVYTCTHAKTMKKGKAIAALIVTSIILLLALIILLAGGSAK